MRKISLIAVLLIVLFVAVMTVGAVSDNRICPQEATATHVFQAAPTRTGGPVLGKPSGTAHPEATVAPQPTYTAEPGP